MEVVEPLLVAPLSPELCLVFGWPIANNLVVQFSSVEEKELWSGLLEKWVPFSFDISCDESFIVLENQLQLYFYLGKFQSLYQLWL